MRRSRSVLSHLALVALLVLLFWTFAPSEALTVSEKQALTELMETFPLLSNMSYVTHGADRWNPDQLDMVCSSVTFYGLSCSGPEVATVAIDDNWGFPIRNQFNAFSGLQGLNYFFLDVTTYSSDLITNLFPALANITTLKQVDIRDMSISQDIVTSAIGNMVTLDKLSVTIDFSATNLNLSRLSSLLTLGLDDVHPVGGINMLSALATASPLLKSFTASRTSLPTSQPFARFNSMTFLTLSLSQDATFDLNDISPATISTLTLIDLPSSVTTLDFSAFPQLYFLTITGGSLVTVNAWPPALAVITLERVPTFSLAGAPLPSSTSNLYLIGATSVTSFPPSFLALAFGSSSLQFISIEDTPIAAIPSEWASTQLSFFGATNTSISDPMQLCNLPSGTLATLSLQNYQDALNNSPLPLPSCFANYLALTSVTLSNIENSPPNMTLHLPPTVTQIYFTNIGPLAPVATNNWTSVTSSFPNLYTLFVEDLHVYRRSLKIGFQKLLSGQGTRFLQKSTKSLRILTGRLQST